MQDAIRDIQSRIRSKGYVNEAAVSSGIVERLLHKLGWDVFDPSIVAREFPVESQRVDYALCSSPGKPCVFIEVKQVGFSTEAFLEQLVNYAFRSGIQLAVLTTGNEWEFYAFYGAGSLSDRRFYKMDLLEQNVEETEYRLRRYLSPADWQFGRVPKVIQDDLEERLSDQQTRTRLPDVWNKLLSQPHEALVELLVSELQTDTRQTPRRMVVENYLRDQSQPTRQYPQPKVSSGSTTQNPKVKPAKVPSSDGVSQITSVRKMGKRPVRTLQLSIRGNHIEGRNQIDLYVRAFNYIAQENPSVLQRIYNHNEGASRTIVATRPVDLYPKNPEFAKIVSRYRRLDTADEWYLDVNLSASQKVSSIRMAATAAGLNFGEDIDLKLD